MASPGCRHSCELKTCLLNAGERTLRDPSPFFLPFRLIKSYKFLDLLPFVYFGVFCVLGGS